MSFVSNEDWDPILQREGHVETPSQQCSYRIKRDLISLFNEPPYGLFVVPDDNDITVIHALITGAFDTPYEGGFFYFILRCPPDYPLRPPRVKLMTTGGGEVRFNPNLYKNGKVCLSILGTWMGPCWSPAQTLSSVLISIQSVLNEKPYHNEPGFEVEKLPGDVQRYNEIIQHETIRVAVCGMIENDCALIIPQMLKNVMEKTFLEYYEYYEGVAMKKMGLTGLPMQDPFSERQGRFQYQNILIRLQNIRAKLVAKLDTNVTDNPATASSPETDTDLDDESSNSCPNTTTTSAMSAAGDTDQGNFPADKAGLSTDVSGTAGAKSSNAPISVSNSNSCSPTQTLSKPVENLNLKDALKEVAESGDKPDKV